MKKTYQQIIEKSYYACDICGEEIKENSVHLYTEKAREEGRKTGNYNPTFSFHEDCLIKWWEKEVKISVSLKDMIKMLCGKKK